MFSIADLTQSLKYVHTDNILYQDARVAISKSDVAFAAEQIFEVSPTITSLILHSTTRRAEGEEIIEWYWNPRGHYFISSTGIRLEAKNLYIIAGESREFARMLTQGLLLEGEWIEQFRYILKSEYIRQYMLARGGYSQMTSADWGRIGYSLRKQYAYLDNLFMRSSEYSEERLRGILELYTDSGHSMFEKGMAASWGASLPAYPGDGSTACLGHCRCFWEFEQDEEEGLVAYWRLDESVIEHCEDCEDRSEEWNPLVLS